MRQTIDAFGRLDMLVANAGIGHSGTVVEADWDDLQTVIGTNIDGVLHGIRACVPAMREIAGGGHILIVSSVVAGVHTPYTATYAASKAFVSSLAGSLRLELEGDNIQVTDLLVGRTVTDFSANRLGPIKRGMSGLPTMQADQVAEAIVRAARRRPRACGISLFRPPYSAGWDAGAGHHGAAGEATISAARLRRLSRSEKRATQGSPLRISAQL